MMRTTQRRPADCVTDLQFDSWIADELTGAQNEAIDRHLADCSRCRERHAELAHERLAFLTERPQLDRKRSSRRHLFGTTAAAALGIAAAAALWAGSPDPSPAESVRIKGGPRIGFYVQREAEAERGTAAVKVAPFDRIHFVYSTPRAAYLAVFGLDARGTATVYFPAGEQAARVDPASERMLDSAVVLDGVLGNEDVFALFCDAPFALEPVRAALAVERVIRPGTRCRIDRLRWSKEATR